MFNFLVKTLAGPYKKALAKNLTAYGLKYEDLLVETPAVVTALARSSEVVQVERARRIRRAFDLDFKKKTTTTSPDFKPYDLYLAKKTDLATFEQLERKALESL